MPSKKLLGSKYKSSHPHDRQKRFAFWKRIIFRFVAGILIANTVLVLGVFVYFLFRLGDMDRMTESYRNELYAKSTHAKNPGINIYSRRGALIGEYLPLRTSRISMKRCRRMKWMRLTAVTSEDRYFYDHFGISFRGIFRAFVSNINSLSFREGGGTITQQLARNLFTDREAPALPRKIFESFSALRLEHLLSKEEILCLYLNHIYMGEGRIGAEEAARFYFRKPPEKLGPAEAAMIVGLFPNPARYSPVNHIRRSLIKQDLTLKAMIRDRHISARNRKRLIRKFKRTYGIKTIRSKIFPGKIGSIGASRNFRRNAAPTANSYVRRYLKEILSDERIRQGNLRVYTTIDYSRQRMAAEAIRARIRIIGRKIMRQKNIARKSRRKILRRLNGVFIAMDPKTGHIRSVVGGYRISEGRQTVQRVWHMRRQTGSAIKGILYAAAIDEQALHADSRVVDEAINFSGYRPRNWYPGFLGPMSLRKAVALSVNTTAVKALRTIGIAAFRNRIGRALELDFFELRNRIPGNLSIALGTAEMTPLELARLYAVLLNGGHPIQARLVLRVEDRDGEILWQAEKTSIEEQDQPIFSDDTRAMTLELLQGVFSGKYQGTMRRFGRARAKNFSYLPFPIAGKSGTVQSLPAQNRRYGGMRGVHDVWFVGMTPDEVAVVWIGHDQGAPFPGGGSADAGSVWVRYASRALPGSVRGHFPKTKEKLREKMPLEMSHEPGHKTGDANETEKTNPEKDAQKR